LTRLGLTDYLGLMENVSIKKIKERRELLEIVERERALGRRIVFTNGCFDLIHVGHIKLLETARRLGECLIVALNTDASIRRIKGDERPVLDESQRGHILGSFQAVDYVTFFDEDTPEVLISEIRPDVLVKGGDYQMDGVAGRQIVWDAGGKVVLCPPVCHRSTSSILNEILQRFTE